MAIEIINLYIGMAISGIFTGLGAAIGAYIANQYVLKRSEKLMKELELRLAAIPKKVEAVKSKVKKERK